MSETRNYSRNDNDRNGETTLKQNPLLYNNKGFAPISASFVLTKDEVEKQLMSIAASYLGNVRDVSIDAWPKDGNTSYNTVTKQNERSTAMEISFQVSIDQNNSNISTPVEDNEFVGNVTQYSQKLTDFVKAFGLDTRRDGGKLYDCVVKRRRVYIILIDPVKLFTTILDGYGTSYEKDTGSKLPKDVTFHAYGLYNNEDVMNLALPNNRREIKRDARLTGFYIVKHFDIRTIKNDKFRPTFNTRQNSRRNNDDD